MGPGIMPAGPGFDNCFSALASSCDKAFFATSPHCPSIRPLQAWASWPSGARVVNIWPRVPAMMADFEATFIPARTTALLLL